MDDTNSLPNDVTQCHQLLMAAYKQSVQLEQQVAELGRVLDETAASYQALQQAHAATLGEGMSHLLLKLSVVSLLRV